MSPGFFTQIWVHVASHILMKFHPESIQVSDFKSGRQKAPITAASTLSQTVEYTLDELSTKEDASILN